MPFSTHRILPKRVSRVVSPRIQLDGHWALGMEESFYFGQLLAAILFAIAGVRLLLLHRRTGKPPELQLGSYFLMSGVSFGCWVIPSIHGFGHLYALCAYLSTAAFSVGVVPFLLFIRRVYRPNTVWASLIVGFCTSLLIASVTGEILSGSWRITDEPPNVWFFSYYLGYTVPCIWMTIEAVIVYEAAKKRALIGLCDPVMANRHLLWALFGSASVLSCFAALYMEFDLGTDSMASSASDALVSLLEIASIATLWMVFFSPLRYRSWIANTRARSDSRGEV